MTPFYLSALKQNLARLCWIRCILLTVECVALGYAFVSELPLPFTLIGNLLALSLGLVVFSFWRAATGRPWPVTELEFAAHLLGDSVLLCALLYLTGGASNPLVSLLLIPLTISAAVLPALYTRVLTAFSLLCYSLLLLFYLPLDIISTHHAPAGISPHIAGMWFTFLLSSILITYFITRMAQTLREQEQRLQQNREETLRDEQVLAVATLAAGAAHDLGTPLSTMRVLLTELEHDTADNKTLNDDIKLLGAQVERCKSTLQNIVQNAQSQSDTENTAIPTPAFLGQLLDNWRSLFPEVQVRLTLDDNVEGAALKNTPSLSHALMNLLNNARAVSDVLDVDVRRDGHRLLISLRDYGPGLSRELLEQIGHSPLNSGGSGLGLGLFLTHATLERIGGSITLDNHPEGGSMTRVFIPLLIGNSYD
ncbi:MAG: two-component system sensor histidine kinase RegB [Halioglobus sp.]|jgi:two-component system sensor histidine kinase RegB